MVDDGSRSEVVKDDEADEDRFGEVIEEGMVEEGEHGEGIMELKGKIDNKIGRSSLDLGCWFWNHSCFCPYR